MEIIKKTLKLSHTSPMTANSSTSDLTDDFVSIAETENDNFNNDVGRLSLTVIYHQYEDEKRAEREAETEAEKALKKKEIKTKFVHIDKGNIGSLISDKKFKEELKNTEQPQKKDNFWLSILIQLLMWLVPSGTISAFLNGELLQKTPWLFYTLIGLIVAITVGVLSRLAVFLVINCNKKKELLRQAKQNFDISAVREWKEQDFLYKNRNVVLIFHQTSESDEYWQLFKKYLAYLPRDFALSCIIFKRGSIMSESTYNAVFYGDKNHGVIGEQEKLEKINTNASVSVAGLLLIPLKEEEKKVLIAELNAPRRYVYRGRDAIYGYAEKADDFLSADRYLEHINGVCETLSKKTQLSADGVKRILSFLAALDRLLAPLQCSLNISDDSVSDIFLSAKVLQTVNDDLPSDSRSNDEKSLKDAICTVWKGWRSSLNGIAERESFLLKGFDDESKCLSLAPFKWAIESFLCYLDYISLSNRNKYYSSAAAEIHTLIDNVRVWHEHHNQPILSAYFVKNYADILRRVLSLNAANGLYAYNYAWLQFIGQIYSDLGATKDEELFAQVKSFFVSQEVEAAFMQNAVVSPGLTADKQEICAGNMSNEHREMHREYLLQRSKILNLDLPADAEAPEYFELFGVCGDNAEYYSLILANNEECILDFYSELYRLCFNAALIGLEYFKFIKLAGEKDYGKVDLSSIKATEKLADCLPVQEQGEWLNIVLDGKPSGEEILACGLLNCDAFYLLHDLYMMAQGSKQFVFSENISAKSYKFVDNFIYIEGVNAFNNSHRFSNMFTDLVRLMTESGNVRFFVKYLLSIINMSGISSHNKQVMTDYLQSIPDLQIELVNNPMRSLNERKVLTLLSDLRDKAGDTVSEYSNEDVRTLLEFSYGIKSKFGVQNFIKMCPFVMSLPAKGKFVEEAQMFVDYVLYEKDVVLSGEAEVTAFVEKLKGFSNNFCFLIYSKATDSNAELYKYSYLIADKLAKSDYEWHLITLIISLEYLDDKHKRGVEITVLNNVNYNVYSENLLKNYNNFLDKYRHDIEDIKGSDYFYDKQLLIDANMTKIRERQSEDLYLHLNRDAGYLFLYARNLLENMCMLRVGSVVNSDVDEAHPERDFEKLGLIFTDKDSGVKFIRKEYLDVVQKLAEGKIKNPDKSVTVKLIADLMGLLDSEDCRITISAENKKLHKRLLSSILERILGV